MEENQPVDTGPGRISVTTDRATYWLSRHWLAVFNMLVGLYVFLPILAPVLMNAGLTGPARIIYTVYSPLCHQMSSRSFFLFGEQYAYPRQVAGANLTPIEAYMADIPEFAEASADPAQWTSFILAARRFVGNEQLGYKMALCERDIAIYGFVFLGGLLYGLLRRRVHIGPLPVWAFLVFGMGPIALDGFSQLFSQYAVALAPNSSFADLLPLRESSPFLRSFTGALFGFCLVWLTYPRIEESMQTTQRDIEAKMQPLA